MYVIESEGRREYTSVQSRTRVEIEAARFERGDEPQLCLIVDDRVVDAPKLVLDRVIQRSHDDPFVEEVPSGIPAMKPPENSSHIRTRDLEGMEPSNSAIDTDEDVNVFPRIEDLGFEDVVLEELLAGSVDSAVFDRAVEAVS